MIDTHTHLWDSPEQLGPEWARKLLEAGAAPWDRPDASPHAFDEAMQEVEHAFVLGLVSATLGIRLAAADVARCVAANPRKYIGFAGVDPSAANLDDAIDEAIALGMAGVVLGPALQGFDAAFERARLVFKRCADEGLVVVVHPDWHLASPYPTSYGSPLIVEQSLREYPELRLVFGHAGDPMSDLALHLARKHEGVYLDLAGVAGRPWQLYNLLVAAQERGVAHKLLVGSDFPFSTPKLVTEQLFAAAQTAQGTNLPAVTLETVRGILGRDALACLGIAPPRIDSPLKAAAGTRGQHGD